MSALTRAWNWLWSPAPLWAVNGNLTFFHWLVPIIFFVTVCLAVVSQRQQRTAVQKALTRFLWAKSSFWLALWIAFHARFSIAWVAFDFTALLATFATSLDLLYALVRRFIIVRGEESPSLQGQP